MHAAGPPTKGNRIVEVAAVEHESSEAMSALVNIAPMQMPEAAQNVHGISTAMVHDPGVPDFRCAIGAVTMTICSARASRQRPAHDCRLSVTANLHFTDMNNLITCSVVGQQFIDFVETSTTGGTPVLVAHNGEAVHMLMTTIHEVPVSSTRVSAYSKRCTVHKRTMPVLCVMLQDSSSMCRSSSLSCSAVGLRCPAAGCGPTR